MDSWKGLNYYTRDNRKWAPLMNLSTADWNIGWLPSNLIAIPGSYNSSLDLPADALVIQNADMDNIGHKEVSAIVFGIASAVVILGAAGWVAYGIWDKSYSVWAKAIFAPKPEPEDRLPTHSGASLATSHTQVNNGKGVDDGFMTAAEFERRMKHFYYSAVTTELELREKGPLDDLNGDDVEEVTELLRKMYDLDLGLWSLQSSPHVTEADREVYRFKSDAILARVRQNIGTWNPTGWPEKDVAYLQEIRGILTNPNGIPEQRYSHPVPPPT